jgi:hypothetical protein
MKYKVTFTKRNRIYTEVEADSDEEAYWKATSIVENGVMHQDYDMAILGPSNVNVKEIK